MNDLSVSYVDSCEIANIKFGSLINPEERWRDREEEEMGYRDGNRYKRYAMSRCDLLVSDRL